MKHIWKIAAAVVCVCLLVTVAFAAFGGAGSQNDPLVTLSYLNGIFTPKVQSMVDQTVLNQQAQNKTELDNAVTDWDTRIKQAIQQAGVSGSNSVSYTTVTLQPGQMLLVAEGCEVILRSGIAGWVSEEAELMDTTGAGSLASGKTLTANHLYLTCGNGVITAAVTSSAPAPSQPAAVTGTVTAGPLNVRATPGGEIVGTVNEGDVVTIIATVDGWYQITIGNLSGYVSAAYVTVNQTGDTSTEAPPAETVTLMLRGTYQVQ